jgi:hypothetical protein
MTENDGIDPRLRLRPNTNDRLYDQQLYRDVQAVNERTMRVLGPLPPGGLPVQPKRKPQVPRGAVPVIAQMPPPSDEDTTMQWTSMAAVAALAASSALAACGAEGTTARVEPPAAVQAPPNEVVLPAVNAEPPAAETAAVEPASSREEETTEPERGPPIPAAQLRQRILALLGSLHALKDLERKNVERIMRIGLVKRPTMEDGYQYFGTTTEGWGYRVGVSRLGRMEEPPTILIDIDEGVEPWTDQQPTYCTLEFEPLAKELVAMGYEQGARAYNRGGNMTWGFGRNSGSEKVGFGVGVIVYNVQQGGGPPLSCVKGFDIGGGPVDE